MQPAGDISRDLIDRALSESLSGSTLTWWRRSRFWWGNLTAEDLLELGCWDTLIREAQELIIMRNRATGSKDALWFLSGNADRTVVDGVGTSRE